MKQLLLLISLSILLSCGNSSGDDTSNQNNDSVIKNETSQNGMLASSSKEMVVSENCVIFLWPDSAEIEKIRSGSDEEAYNEIIADMTWYPGIAAEVLDSFKIKNIACSNEYLILKNAKNKETKLKRKAIEGNMILFRIDKEPVFSNAIDFDRDLTLKYFGKR